MRRFLSTPLIALVLFLGATGAAPLAHAAVCVPGYLENADGVSGINPDGKECTVGASSGASSSSSGATSCPTGQTLDFQSGNCVSVSANGTVTQGAPPTETANAAATAAADTPANPATAADTHDSEFNWVMEKIMSLFAWLVGVAALTLDSAVFYTVVTMGSYIHKLAAVGVAWRILRDIGNIMLIFGFLAVGITTILNVEWYGGGKKMLPMMLVAAVFLNFSLFFAEAIVDTGNLFATQFYTQINGGNLPTAAMNAGATVKNEGISNKLMSQLGLQTLYNVNDGKVRKEIFQGNNPWLIGFMGILLFIVTAFVMFSLAFILVARFVALIFLIILAPVGFAGLAVPMLARRAGQWWDKLFEQTITAPILLLMLYVALAVITDAQFLTGFQATPGGLLGFINNNNLAGFGGTILSFIVAMGLLLAVTIQAKNLSAFGAGWATKTAGALTFGATAIVGRTTVGWGANKIAKGLRGTMVGRVPIVGTNLVKGLDKVAGSSFDARGATIGGGLKGIGIEAGAAQKGGYKADLKSRIESRTKYASELTGRKLTDAETAAIAVKENEIADLRKSQKGKTASEIMDINKDIRIKEKEIEGLEEHTDKGAKRKYASVLEFLPLAANTEAAKKIREDAKKSKDDKELDALRKALKKAGSDEGGAAPAGPAAAPAAGGAAPAGHP